MGLTIASIQVGFRICTCSLRLDKGPGSTTAELCPTPTAVAIPTLGPHGPTRGAAWRRASTGAKDVGHEQDPVLDIARVGVVGLEKQWPHSRHARLGRMIQLVEKMGSRCGRNSPGC